MSNTTGTTNCKICANLKKDGDYEIYIHITETVKIGSITTTNELTIENIYNSHEAEI